MKHAKLLPILFLALIFLTGLGVCLYPMINGSLVDFQIRKDALGFLEESRVYLDTNPTAGSFVVQEEIQEPTAPDEYTDLWLDMHSYNQELYTQNQSGLDGPSAYEKTEFKLKDYGLEDEIFGVISIPKMDLEMPIYIGASSRHMADGTAILGQTSIPLGGKNTNAVIAGHRGWGGAKYFKEIDKLKPGDHITITNLWEVLHYTVTEIQIIMPSDVEAIHIKKDRELITLMSCHPFASGGRQRYLVICDRTYDPIPNTTKGEYDHVQEIR